MITRAQRRAGKMSSAAFVSLPKTKRKVKNDVKTLKKSISKSKKTKFYAYFNGHWRRAYIRVERTKFFVVVNGKRIGVPEGQLMSKDAIRAARHAAKNRRRRARRAAGRGSSYKPRGSYKKGGKKKRKSRGKKKKMVSSQTF